MCWPSLCEVIRKIFHRNVYTYHSRCQFTDQFSPELLIFHSPLFQISINFHFGFTISPHFYIFIFLIVYSINCITQLITRRLDNNCSNEIHVGFKTNAEIDDLIWHINVSFFSFCRHSKSRTIHQDKTPVTGLAFRHSQRNTYLFVVTETCTLSFNLTGKEPRKVTGREDLACNYAD